MSLALSLTVLLMTTGRPAASMAAERTLTLNQAVDLALKGNEGLAIRRESVAEAGARVSAASGAYDPLFALDGGWAHSDAPLNTVISGPIAPDTRTTDLGLSVSQLLATGAAVSLVAGGSRQTSDASLALLSPGYATRLGVELRQPLLRDLWTDRARRDVRVARSGERGAAALLDRAVEETVASVERAYWALVAARLEVDVRRQSVQLAEEQLQDTQARVNTGSAPRTELAEPRAELERRRGELLASRESAIRSENALKLLILNGAGDPLWADSLAPIENVTMDTSQVDRVAAVGRALERRPEIALAQAVVEGRAAETAYARNTVWPSLDAVVSYDRFGIAGSATGIGSANGADAFDGGLHESIRSLGDDGFDAVRVAFELALPLPNREARGHAAAARHLQNQAELELAGVRKAVRAEVLDAVAALETAAQRIDAAHAAREAAEVQLSAERDRFATGLSTNFLVLTRQNDLSRAQLDEISALTDYRVARVEIQRATGALSDAHGIDAETAR